MQLAPEKAASESGERRSK